MCSARELALCFLIRCYPSFRRDATLANPNRDTRQLLITFKAFAKRDASNVSFGDGKS
jgi:hypothetical protein